MRQIGLVVCLGALLLLVACSTSRRRRCCPVSVACPDAFVRAVPRVVAPAQVFAREGATPWSHLAARYDKDRDGKITPEERGRDEAGFERLDKDKDGVLTEADFAQVDRMYQMIAQMTLMRYFQDDDAPRDLHRTELQAAFKRHDANEDGVLSQAELAAARKAHAAAAEGGARKMPTGVDPYRALLAVADQDKSGTVARTELEAFFDARDDGDGKWEPRMPGAGRTRPPGGVAPGEPAPDFSLRPPNGGAAITLSQFKGKRPVALVFGSYT